MGRAVIWKVVIIRGMAILLLVWLVLFELVGGGSMCELISDNVRIVGKKNKNPLQEGM